MKKSQLLYLSVVIIFFAHSCKEKSTYDSSSTGIKTISLPDAIGKERIVNLSEVAKSIRYIPLETSDSSLLGNIPRPILENGVFYVTIRSGLKEEFMMYNIDGKFLGKLGRYGRAAGEYQTNMSSLALSVDYKSGNPIIFSTNKVIEFDKKGNFIKEVKSPVESTFNLILLRVKKLGDNYISTLYDFDQRKSFYLFFNANGEAIEEAPELPKAQNRDGLKTKESNEVSTTILSASNAIAVSIPYMYDYKDNTRLMGNTDTLYTFNPKMEKRALYHFEYGKYELPLNSTGDQRSQSIFLISGFTCEWEDHLFLTYNFGNNEPNGYTPPLVRGVFNKKRGDLTLLKRVTPEIGGFKNDLDNGAPFWPVHISREGEMIMPLSAAKFIELSEKYDSPEMKRVAATLTEESNPVMVVVKL
ncbi:MAG: hypothetical protein CVU13_04240 [Bacteroidetes bacterium HGW-Bacteroidetes-8]|jgi:hypothetical protein|nr:MAG: hypothetical protein CVU13_04240 [Bacteroidetes bacterium HGW-Bacteroidetes-8]